MIKNLALFTFLLSFNVLAIAQSKSLPSFNAIKTAGSVQVTLLKGDATKAEYTIIKGKAEDLYMEVENGLLTVKIKSKSKGWNRSETKARVTIYYNQLASIDCAAGSSLSGDDAIDSDQMSLGTSSGASCNVKINCKDLDVNTSSGASLTITGKANNAKFDASSGSTISASNMVVVSADADVSSGASIKLNATKRLKADASSGGSIKYKGKPESVNIDSGMSGSVSSF